MVRLSDIEQKWSRYRKDLWNGDQILFIVARQNEHVYVRVLLLC